MKEVKYYESFEDDFVETKIQDYKLKDNYKWIHNNLFYKVFSFIIYLIILLVSLIYSKLVLHITIKNKKVLRGKKGYYIYSNHTLELGDVFNPFITSFPHHPYIICSPSNLGIPFIGKILPIAGALPIGESIHDKKELMKAVEYHIKKGSSIVIYPEAHLWPYATFIREYSSVSFNFPIYTTSAVFASTTTYQKSKIFKKPKITIYIDGPFYIDENLTKKENVKKLHDEVYNTMTKRSKLNTCKFIEYKKK